MIKRMFVLLVLMIFAMPQGASAIPGHLKRRMGTMSGQLFFAGQPISNALVAFFDEPGGLPPIKGGLGRIPKFLSRADDDGKFAMKLLEGSYYIGVMVRPPDARRGPPREGESFYFADDGNGKLRSLAITDFKQVDYGRIDCSLPDLFTETADHFTVEGVVLKGEGENPVAGASILAKGGQERIRRPDYFSMPTGADGKFSINLPAGTTFYLLARELITGAKPNPGENIGKFGTDSVGEAPAVNNLSGASPPPGVMQKDGIRQVAGDSIPVSGGKGDLVSGVTIHLYKMPDRQAIKESLQGTEGGLKFETGAELNNIFFATNSSELDERSSEELNIWANFLKGSAEIVVEISGHTDSVGDALYNKTLSEKRAQSVAAFIQEKGVAAGRIVVVGYGEERPVDDNETAFGRERNRRVEIKFVQKK